MAKNKNNLSNKDLKNKKCKVADKCNISDVTDSVEFANEPFDNVNKQKCAQNKDKKNNNC